MIRGKDLHYNAMRQYKRAIMRGDPDTAIRWALVLDCQLVVMHRTKRLRLRVTNHRAGQKKSKRRNPRVRKKQAL